MKGTTASTKSPIIHDNQLKSQLPKIKRVRTPNKHVSNYDVPLSEENGLLLNPKRDSFPISSVASLQGKEQKQYITLNTKASVYS